MQRVSGFDRGITKNIRHIEFHTFSRLTAKKVPLGFKVKPKHFFGEKYSATFLWFVKFSCTNPADSSKDHCGYRENETKKRRKTRNRCERDDKTQFELKDLYFRNLPPGRKNNRDEIGIRIKRTRALGAVDHPFPG